MEWRVSPRCDTRKMNHPIHQCRLVCRFWVKAVMIYAPTEYQIFCLNGTLDLYKQTSNERFSVFTVVYQKRNKPMKNKWIRTRPPQCPIFAASIAVPATPFQFRLEKLNFRFVLSAVCWFTFFRRFCLVCVCVCNVFSVEIFCLHKYCAAVRLTETGPGVMCCIFNNVTCKNRSIWHWMLNVWQGV